MDKEEKMAMAMVDEIVKKAKKSDREEKIVLIKHPGSEDAESLDISIEMKFGTHTAPLYVGKIIQNVAEEIGISFDELVIISHTFMELMDKVTDCISEDLNKENTNED